MPVEDSPLLEEFKDGLPEKLPDSQGPRKVTRSIIAILGLLTVILAATNFVKSGVALTMFRGKGTVTGYVVDENHIPIVVEIYILGTDIEAMTDQSGYFEIQGVPAGSQSIAAVTEETGDEFPVEVVAGSIVGMGELQLITSDAEE